MIASQQPPQTSANQAPPAAPEAKSGGASISLDALFASASQPSPQPPPAGPVTLPPAQQAAPAPPAPSHGLPLLDAIFQSAATPVPAAPPQQPTPEPRAAEPQAASPSAKSATDPAAGLMAMLGLSSPSKPSSTSAPPPSSAAPNAAPSGSATPAAPSGPQTTVPALQTLFNGATAAAGASSPAPAQPSKQQSSSATPAAPTNGAGQPTAEGQAKSFRETSRDLLSEQIAKVGIAPAAGEDVMSKTEFVREILGLIHVSMGRICQCRLELAEDWPPMTAICVISDSQPSSPTVFLRP